MFWSFELVEYIFECGNDGADERRVNFDPDNAKEIAHGYARILEKSESKVSMMYFPCLA